MKIWHFKRNRWSLNDDIKNAFFCSVVLAFCKNVKEDNKSRVRYQNYERNIFPAMENSFKKIAIPPGSIPHTHTTVFTSPCIVYISIRHWTSSLVACRRVTKQVYGKQYKKDNCTNIQWGYFFNIIIKKKNKNPVYFLRGRYVITRASERRTGSAGSIRVENGRSVLRGI